MEAAVLSALGEPSRLQIVELLRTRACAVGEIAARVGLRQPQASKHLRVLTECGVVRVEPRARQRIYHLRREPFEAVAHWIDSFESTWDARLDRLGDFLNPDRPEPEGALP